MRKHLLLIAASIFITNIASAQDLLWAKEIGVTDTPTRSYSITTDNVGNVYVTGSFNLTCDFDPGPGVYNLTSLAGVGGSTYILKLDANGNFIWAKKMDTQYSWANFIKVDNNGGLYIAGGFSDTTDFDPGTGVYQLPTTSDSDINAFVLKLDTAGNFIWAKQLGNNSTLAVNNRMPDEVHSFCIGPSSNLYIAGSYRYTVDFDPGAGMHNLTTANGFNLDIYLLSLDSAGNFLWVTTAGITDPFEYHGGMAVANNGDVLAAIRGPLGKLIKYDSQGSITWSKDLSLNGWSIATDNNNNIYYAGNFIGTKDFDPGTAVFNMSAVSIYYDGFVLKLDANGNFIWAKQLGQHSTVNNISVDINGSVYIAGNFEGTGDFDPSTPTFNLTAAGTGGWDDIFLLKLDAQGNFLNALQFSGERYEFCNGICIDDQSSIFIAGAFLDTVDFDPGAGVYNMAAGLIDPDAFILKLSSTLGVEEITKGGQSAAINIYPNPSTGTITISSTSVINKIQVTDALGRVVHSVSPQGQLHKMELDVAAGMYYISVMSDDGVRIEKVAINQ